MQSGPDYSYRARREVPYPEPALNVAGSRTGPEKEPGAMTFRDLIDKAAEEQGVSAKLVRAVIQVESGYRERARSRKGAMGLMQLMPITAHR